MNWYVYIVLCWIFSAFLCSAVAVVFSQSKLARVSIVLIFLVTFGLTFTAPFELMGRAKPADWAWLERHVEEAEIKGEDLREDEGIYLMLTWDGLPPRLYKFPWRQDMAQNLIEQRAQAQQSGAPLMIGQPFEGGGPLAAIGDAVGELIDGLFGNGQGQGEGEGENGQGEGGNFSNSLEDRPPPLIYPKPQEANPPKPEEDQGLIYDPENSGR